MIINILCDNPNSWFWDFGNEFIKGLQKNHDVHLARNQGELVKGDIAAFISCTTIVDNKNLKLNKSNIVCHPSKLPKGRGFSPIAWEVLAGCDELSFTLFEANEYVDDGLIYLVKTVDLEGTELNSDLRNIQAKVTFELINVYIKNYPNIEGKKQIGKPTFYKRRTKDDLELNIDKTLNSQFNILRVSDNKNYPAFFYFKGQKYVLKIEKDS